ncbi:phage N-6-adenine-methyltransferase [Atlantibacter hermannii]|uniref:phage N-6-adenine-methyltransferase n=1 Tax=Atlantibacter hermannii TaxID=565 RepID=UPI0028AAF7FA|nr:phage N-6-adenine-methyltransferase [Atlantibacter hermannii]
MTDYGGSKTPESLRDTWRTPPEIFEALNAEFIFQMDAAASEQNRLCRLFISEEENTLTTAWSQAMGYAEGYVWMNPPYSDIGPFVDKAAHENKWSRIGCVMLLPADTSVGWFIQAIETASEVRFITGGRLSFIDANGKAVSGNPKGSMLIIWHPWPRTHCLFSTVKRDELMRFGAHIIEKRNAA